MKKQPTTIVKVLMILALTFSLGLNTFAQSKNNFGVKDYTSIAQISGTSSGETVSYTNPFNNQSASNFAGTFHGTLNSNSEKFYCIDLQHGLVYNQDYWDESSTPSEITYILNNYYPYKTSYSGKLSDNDKEAAAVQMAIWHFSDGLNANTISNSSTIKNRTLAIIADANANHANTTYLQTLMIVPVSQSFIQGTPVTFNVYALDLNGNPVDNANIQLSTTLGTLSATTVTTNSMGQAGPITLNYSGLGSATIKAKTNVEIPQGTRYVHKTMPDEKQKLVLATPAFDLKEVSTTVEWYAAPTNCDTKGFVTFTQGGWGSPSNSGPGIIRDSYFNNVFPSDLTVGGGTYKLTLTSAEAVKNFLPADGTPSAFTQNYTNPSSTSAGILAGQITALKLNVKYDEAGYIGSNPLNLGELIILSGPFEGYTVYQFLAFAEEVIGGGNLNGFTYSQINDAATAINENFVEGKVDNGYLICEVEECENTLGDFVWHDKNVDGIQNAAEPGISGVIVELLKNSGVIATDTTDSNGKYEFTNLANGTYEVRIASSNTSVGGALYSNTQKKWYSTKKNQGSDDSKDSDGGINQKVTVTLDCNNNPTIDFGFYYTCITINKTANKQTAKPGDVITYTFEVENCGDVQHHGGVDVFDAMLGWTNSNPYHINILNPGEIKTFTKDYTVKADDCGELKNTVRADGHPVDGSATVSDQSSATVIIDCGLTCVTDWTATLGPDSAICVYDQTYITINGTVSITPNPSQAYLQLSWRIVYPNDGSVDNSTHYQTIPITQDTIFSITALWPGIRPTDEVVEIHYGVNVLDCNGNPIKNGIGRDLYWYPWVCNPPEEKEADVMIEKFSSTSNPQCGEQFTYTIKVTNNGPNEAKGIQATDLLPAGLNYVSSNASQGTYDSNTGLWTVGDLSNGANATLTIAVIADCDEINNSTFDFGVAKDYNLFVILDATQPSSDTQGRVAVGRNASFGNYSVGDQLPPNSGDVLVVGNDLTYTSGAIYNGNVVYGNTTNLPQYAVSITGGTLRQDNPINFSAAKTYLENLSAALSAYPVNGTMTTQWGGINLTGTDPYLNVFSVNGSDLSSANNVAIDVPNGAVVLVNINGTNVSWMGGLTVNGTAINNVLYNFYQATQMTIQGIDIRGSILAPFADVNFAAGVQNGQMMCKSLTGSGQFNHAPFMGNIPVEKRITNTASIASTITTDTDPNNNSASVEVVVNSTSNNNGGTSGGNTGGTNNGNDWQQVSGFGVGEIVYTMTYSGNFMYAGTWGGKIYMSSDNGQNWTCINEGMNVGFVWSLQVSGNYIFAATEQGVFKFDGSSWALTSLTGMDVHALASHNGIIYAGTWGLGVYKSEDNGTTWTSINNGLGYILTVQSLTINSSGEIFVGTAGGGMFRSSNNGESFTKLSCGYELIWALGVTNNNTLFAGSYGDGLYRSTDGGSTFEKVSLNVPFIYSIVVDANNRVYVTSWASGVFVSADNGATWTSLGMSGVGVSSLMISGDADQVFVGTKEGKIFMSSIDGKVTDVENENSIPTKFELNQNFPNPFNPTTTIRFAVTENGNYSLRVYDILGQEVATLIDGQLNIGNHQVTFDASRLASGMYIYKLTGSNVNLTKKMILMK